jgi:hypothetical protein
VAIPPGAHDSGLRAADTGPMRASVVAVIAAFALLACGPASPKPAPPPPPPPAAPAAAVTEEAIAAFVEQALPDAIAAGTIAIDWGSSGGSVEVIEELALVGIDDMAEVAALLPADFAAKGVAALVDAGDTTNVTGLMRDLMIIRDARAYFTKAWRNHWVASGPEEFPVPVAYGVDFAALADLHVFGDSGGDED